MKDFRTNVIGTLNLLEALRLLSPNTVFIYASTNKVYGSLSKLRLTEGRDSYILDSNIGISEKTSLDFHTPYGCSKGSGDQYVLDYGRSFGLKTFTFRQSCIYGTFQRGIEDQGWLAWFALARLTGHPIKLFGNGKQVRDLLYVEDLVQAYLQLFEVHEKISERVFNIGGGYKNSISVIKALKLIDEKLKLTEEIIFEPERTGDQKYFVSDNSLIYGALKWEPQHDISKGLDLMLSWMKENLINSEK
jgi:CDP-paratose 2-epimerase